ncbi:MAG: cupin domain-containing protein [Ferruginibacter sp.]
MDTNVYIASGILESYCLGLVTEGERMEVEQYAKIYIEIREELAKINDSLEMYALEKGIKPKTSVKIELLLKLYEQQCGTDRIYPPLIKEDTVTGDFNKWIDINKITEPAEPFDNLATVDLPSTEVVTNFMVWAKKGHEEEEHNEYHEFIVILKGHCDMYFGTTKKHYNTGDIIIIPPHIPHSAVITSDEPMIALVQRQAIAA